MRKIALAAALVMLAPGVHAEDAAAIAARIGGLSVKHMAVAYACRSAVGEAHYRSARTLAIENGVASGMNRNDAILAVNDLDGAVREQAGSATPSARDCLNAIGNIVQEIQVESARLQAAR